MSDFAAFWNVDRPPFGRPADPSSPFVPQRLKVAYDRLLLVTAQGLPLTLVTGESGSGKTTLLRWLFQNLDNRTHEMLLTTLMRRERQAGWLTPRLLALFGGGEDAARGRTPGEQLRAVAERMDELTQEKRRLVVAVDAAHLLDHADALEELESFLNLQSLGEGVLSFVLAGAPSLARLVAEQPALKARLAFHLETPRLARDELELYVQHRLKAAGLAPGIFDGDALDWIMMQTRGLHAAVNVHADACMLEAFARRVKKVSVEVARAAGDAMAAGELRAAGEAPAAQELRAASGEPYPPPPPAPDPALAAPATVAPTARGAPPPPQNSASIRLSSLFKSAPKGSKDSGS